MPAPTFPVHITDHQRTHITKGMFKCLPNVGDTLELKGSAYRVTRIIWDTHNGIDWTPTLLIVDR